MEIRYDPVQMTVNEGQLQGWLTFLPSYIPTYIRRVIIASKTVMVDVVNSAIFLSFSCNHRLRSQHPDITDEDPGASVIKPQYLSLSACMQWLKKMHKQEFAVKKSSLL